MTALPGKESPQPWDAPPADAVPIALPTQANRKLRRTKAAKAKRPNGRARREPLYRIDESGEGYSILHPTKGWRTYSGRRLAATASTNARKWGNEPWWRGVSAMERRVANG